MSLDRERVQVQSTGRTVCKLIKWKENNTQLVLNDLWKKKQAVLQSKLDVPFTNLRDVTRCVEEFCEIINQCVLPHAEVFEVKYKSAKDDHKKKTCNKNKGDKPWFDEHCRFLSCGYRNCLCVFNSSNSNEHR